MENISKILSALSYSVFPKDSYMKLQRSTKNSRVLCGEVDFDIDT